MTLRIALFEPDIPQNTGAIMRLGACLGIPIDIIEPCGFPISDRALRRAAMDYGDIVDLAVHPSWDDFRGVADEKGRRTVLLSTKAAQPYLDFCFESRDTLLMGRESAGVPDHVHRDVAARITIPMAPGARSLNVAMAAALVAGEAQRQLSVGGGAPLDNTLQQQNGKSS